MSETVTVRSYELALLARAVNGVVEAKRPVDEKSQSCCTFRLTNSVSDTAVRPRPNGPSPSRPAASLGRQLTELDVGRIERLLALEDKFAREGLTFDDVLLVPAESHVMPNDVSTATRLTRNLSLALPVVSAAMDTVTESRMAVAMARVGGLGVLHRNLSIADQVAEVDRVKRSESGMIVDPVTLGPDALVAEALELMARYRISGVPITDADGRLVGILTNRDLRFEKDPGRQVSELMTQRNLVTAPVGTTLEEAEEILHRNKIEKLPVVDADGMLRGLITVKDIAKRIEYPQATKDARGRLCVGRRRRRRTGRARAGRRPVAAADVDVLVVDTAHGHSQGVLDMVRRDQGRRRRSTSSPATSRRPRPRAR